MNKYSWLVYILNYYGTFMNLNIGKINNYFGNITKTVSYVNNDENRR